jgi:type I restriction enzyme S subunit
MPTVKLGDIAIESKETFKDDKAGVPIVGLEHLTPNEVTLSNWSVDVDNTFTKMFRKGDVLFGRRRAYLKKAAVAPFNGVCSGDITVIRAKDEKLFPDLLPFIIQNDDLFDYAVGKSAGSLSPRVKWSHLQNYKLNLPDMDKQIKLAELLWSINDTRLAYQSLLNKTDELVKSQFIEMFGEPNKNPNAVSFESAFTIRDDLRKPINDAVRSEMHTGQLYPYYGANGQVDSINEYLMDCDAICLAEDCGAYGAGEATSYIVSGKCWVNNHAHVLIPKECCDIEFANVYFRILDMSEYVTGTTRLKLTQGKMKTLPMILPPMDQQKQFAAFVRQSDKSKFALQKSMNDLRAMFNKVLSGNLEDNL